MKFRRLILILIATVSVPCITQAQAAIESIISQGIRLKEAKVYFAKSNNPNQPSFGYSSQCGGAMCLPEGSRVFFSGYEDVPMASGKKLRVGIIQRYVLPDGTVRNVENQNYNLALQVVTSRDRSEVVTTIPRDENLFLNFRGQSVDWAIPLNEPNSNSAPSARTASRDTSAPARPQATRPRTATSVSAPVRPNLEATASCELCGPESNKGPIQNLADRVVSLIGGAGINSDYKKKIGEFISQRLRAPKELRLGSGCTNFIDTNGDINSWGISALTNMKSVCNDCFFGSEALGVQSLCPKFKNFSQHEKEYFWVWVYTSIAHAESTCIPRSEARGTKDPRTGVYERAVGLMQLEKSWARRRSRGPECSTRQGETVFDIDFQFRCSASIMRDTRWRAGLPLYGRPMQYWHRLQTTNGKISNLIKTFPGCR
jgi:hypothetical protein